MPSAGSDSTDVRNSEFVAVYENLRRRARRLLANNDGGSLNTTALVHEAYLKLAGGRDDSATRAHFFRVAATAMRQILIDHARYKRAQVRDHRLEGTLDVELPVPGDGRVADVLTLDNALTRLRSESESLVRIVELHFFAGLSFAEISELEGRSLSTVERQWRTARAWLNAHMRDDRD
jgi:RNA polymerase sigma factor (TIGR02999 family)